MGRAGGPSNTLCTPSHTQDRLQTTSAELASNTKRKGNEFGWGARAQLHGACGWGKYPETPPRNCRHNVLAGGQIPGSLDNRRTVLGRACGGPPGSASRLTANKEETRAGSRRTKDGPPLSGGADGRGALLLVRLRRSGVAGGGHLLSAAIQCLGTFDRRRGWVGPRPPPQHPPALRVRVAHRPCRWQQLHPAAGWLPAHCPAAAAAAATSKCIKHIPPTPLLDAGPARLPLWALHPSSACSRPQPPRQCFSTPTGTEQCDPSEPHPGRGICENVAAIMGAAAPHR
jgi:hypothetical protein